MDIVTGILVLFVASLAIKLIFRDTWKQMWITFIAGIILSILANLLFFFVLWVMS
jgi:uncharacterized membrane protein YjjP (DUF1212 family)